MGALGSTEEPTGACSSSSGVLVIVFIIDLLREQIERVAHDERWNRAAVKGDGKRSLAGPFVEVMAPGHPQQLPPVGFKEPAELLMPHTRRPRRDGTPQ